MPARPPRMRTRVIGGVVALGIAAIVMLLLIPTTIKSVRLDESAETHRSSGSTDPVMRRYEFRINEWLTKCPLQQPNRRSRYSGEIITGPADICNNEHLRRGMQNEYRWGPSVPMDVFVMADGESSDRHVTKIGGLPYRPASRAWPVNSAGEPLLFLAQFNFTDSIDLVGDLPAPLLLVFADWNQGRFEELTFEWQPQTSSRLIDANEVPEHPGSFAPCFGYRFRTINFPTFERIRERGYPQCMGMDVWSDYHVPVYQATQIGTSPFWIQGRDENLPGEIICTISSVQPAPNKAYPWVNQEHQIPLEALRDDEHLMLSDMGCLYISMDQAGNLHWCEQSY